MTYRVGVDVGGTFTDLVGVADDGTLRFAKVPSVPADPSDAVMAVLAEATLSPADVAWFAHGTTVATNALLERRGASIALVTTRGFRDVIEIGRQDRPALYDLTRDRPPTLVPRAARFTLTERCGPDGVLVPLDDAEVEALAVELAGLEGLAAVAVCLLFSFAWPEHEQRVAAILRDRLPGVLVVCSTDVLPQLREYERFATTVADAYLAPKLAVYLTRLAERAGPAGFPLPFVMQSSGGVTDLTGAASRAAACVLSGPAAGVVGAAYVGSLSGAEDLLTFDMGGTSTDVAAVLAGQVTMTTSSLVGGVPIMLPSVDVHSVSAGGGSIAWVDSGAALRVGPTSAGAEPGPACYGRGGIAPTVTDADLLLGHLADAAVFGGRVRLSRARAEQALGTIGERLGMSALEVAEGVVKVADAQMAKALRVVSVERGLDPRDLTLVAFGGAGGMHACALAEDLGCPRVLVPLAGGVLSALGLAVGDLRRDYVLPVIGGLGEVALEPSFAVMAQRARADLPDAVHARYADCRYAGQSHELTVPCPTVPPSGGTCAGPDGSPDGRTTGPNTGPNTRPNTRPDGSPDGSPDGRTTGPDTRPDTGPNTEPGGRTTGPDTRPDTRPDTGTLEPVDVAGLRAAFEARHTRRYGYCLADDAVEVVAVRLVARVPGARPGLTASPADPDARTGRRPVWLDGSWQDVEVLPRAALGPGDAVRGPAVVEFAEATCLVRGGWAGKVDQVGTLVLERS